MKQENTPEAFKHRLEQALLGFETDPADSDYQRGYEACLKEIKKDFDTVKTD